MKATNPTLLTLLKAGCKVTFPSGYHMSGDTARGYIDLGHEFGPDGVRTLNRDGVLLSLEDERYYRKSQEQENV